VRSTIHRFGMTAKPLALSEGSVANFRVETM
jgi:hypothetical protein